MAGEKAPFGDPEPAFALTVVTLDPPAAAIRASGELDLAARQDLAGVLRRLEADERWVVGLDLSQVTFLDCSCLDTLVAAHQRLLDRQGGLVLTGVGARIARILAITALDEVLFIDHHKHHPADGLPTMRIPRGCTSGRRDGALAANFETLMTVADQLDGPGDPGPIEPGGSD